MYQTSSRAPALGVLLRLAGIDQRHERGAPAARQALIEIGAAVGVEQRAHFFVRLQEGREDIAARGGFPDRVEIARPRDPHRRVRRLIGSRPEIDEAPAREAPFEIERLVGGPRLDREIDALP
jgi:hypothetical protein